MFLKFCPICNKVTLWLFKFRSKKDNTWLVFRCGSCDQIHSLQPQEKWPSIQ